MPSPEPKAATARGSHRDNWRNLILVLKATLKGPKAGSQHPAENRPRRSWSNRRQRAAATPDFPPRTGVTAGTSGAEKQKVGGSTPPLTTISHLRKRALSNYPYASSNAFSLISVSFISSGRSARSACLEPASLVAQITVSELRRMDSVVVSSALPIRAQGGGTLDNAGRRSGFPVLYRHVGRPALWERRHVRGGVTGLDYW